jgi:hypothetical protein
MPGVNTQAWGKQAWIFIHALALAVDLALARLHGDARRKLTLLARATFDDLKHAVPCIHCRRSYSGFLHMQGTRLSLVGGSGDDREYPFSHYAYLIHERVNRKLFWQDAAKGAESAVTKWRAYQPEFGKEAYAVGVETDEFRSALVNFVFYVLHDYDPVKQRDRCQHTLRFLKNVSRLLCEVGCSVAPTMAQMMRRPPAIDASLRARLAWWHGFQTRVLPESHPCCMDLDDRARVCDIAVVKKCG